MHVVVVALGEVCAAYGACEEGVACVGLVFAYEGDAAVAVAWRVQYGEVGFADFDGVAVVQHCVCWW